MSRRVLMVSPHFPPDSTAAAHRVRLLAPHLPKYGWEPTVVSVDPRDYEGPLDPGLAQLVPPGLRVVRARAWPARWTRRLGVGDLGLRAFKGLHDACVDLLRRERFDALFITIFPTYPAVLGPILARRFGIPFVLDYIDPWVGAWGRTVGSGPDGRPDLKSRLTRALATRLEPRVVRAASALTAVSAQTYEDVFARHPALAGIPGTAIPFGGEAADFDAVRRQHRANPYFDPKDGSLHLCYVGTLLPLGFETLRAVLRAIARLEGASPGVHARLRLHCFGTSNQRGGRAAQRVLPVARELGVDDRVHEIAHRVDYLDALTVQLDATAILLMGSTEHHYTASKLYPALLARRPILAVYHERSSVVDILRRAARPSTRVVTYTDTERAESRVEAIGAALSALADDRVDDVGNGDDVVLRDCSAEALAGTLADVLDRAARARAR
jgi:glycosyltransferase involved in cell wall biosynthesis